MEFLSDDPTYLAGGLGLLAGVFLIALRLTQQGKYLVWAAVSLALALVVVGVEQAWVTDNERIEETIYNLGRAVERGDVPGVLELLTPDVQYVISGNTFSSEETRQKITTAVENARFDFLRISHLQASAGGESRRGRADFRVLCSGSFNTLNFGSVNSAWSLGLRETSPGTWKVNRISPVYLPGQQNVLPTTLSRPESQPLFSSPTSSDFPRRRRGSGRRSAAAMIDFPDTTPPPMVP